MFNPKVCVFLAALSLAGCSNKSWIENRLVSEQPEISQTVEAPVWRTGSEWQYNDGYGLKVIKTDGKLTTFQRLDDARQWIVRRGFLREDAQSSTTLRKLMFEDLPSGAGQLLTTSKPLTYRREFMSGGLQRTHATSWTIEGRETVKVPAGEFDCIILVMRTRNLAQGWTGFERWWFSPQAGNFVRMEYRYGSDQPGSRVLTRFHLAT